MTKEAKAKVNGRCFESSTTAEKQENGDWTVTVLMTEKRRFDGVEEWEVKTLSAMCTDKAFESAYSTAMTSATEQFNDIISMTKTDSLFE